MPPVSTYTDAILHSLKVGKLMLHRYVDDLQPSEFTHQPVAGANHAAWIVGHLARTLRVISERLGLANLPPVPEGWKEQFAATKQAAPKEQPAGHGPELIQLFDQHLDALAAFVPTLPASKLAEAAPVHHPLFSTWGEMLHFMGIHVVMHAGQLSTIRRSLGKPPVN